MARVEVGWTYVIDTRELTTAINVYVIRVANDDLYKVFVLDQTQDIYWVKSTDGGFTWNEPTVIATGTIEVFGVWYDQWSTATGNLIYIVWLEAAVIHFRTLDTSTDTLGTDVSAFTGVSQLNSLNIAGVTKAVGGNLFIAYDIDGGTENGMVRSTDAGATWAAAATPFEGVNDWIILVPDFQADTQDIMAFFWDKSADEVDLKRYDDSLDSWAVTNLATGMTDGSMSQYQHQFSAAVDRENSRVFMLAWSVYDTLNADLRFWTITASTETEGTNVITNSPNNQAACALMLSTTTGDLYALYGGKSDGSENPGTLMNVWYKISTDDGATWGTEIQLSAYARDFSHLFVTPRFTDTDFVVMYGGLNAFQPSGGPAFWVNIPKPSVVLGNPVNIATGQDKTTSTTLSTTSTIDALTDQIVIAVLATDNENTADGETSLHTSITISGQGMTKLVEYTNTVGGAANDGATVSIWYLIPTADIVAGETVAATLNTDKDAKAITVYVLDLGDGYDVTLDGKATLSNDGADPGSMSVTGGLDTQHLWIRGVAAETANVAVMTPSAGWTSLTGIQTSGGADASNIAVRGEIKRGTGVSSGASDPTYAAADCASALVGLALTIPGGGDTTVIPNLQITQYIVDPDWC